MATLDDVLKIPGNNRAYERLRGLLTDKRATAFVGAGASAGLYPLWPTLMEKLAHEPVARGLAGEAEERHWRRLAQRRPMEAAQLIRHVLPESDYFNFLYDTFTYREPKFTETQRLLMGMSFRAWLTTNYDPGLMVAGGLREVTSWHSVHEIRRWITGEAFNEEDPPLLFAHGFYREPESIVLDRDSYRKAYERGGAYRRLFDILLLQHQLVFVGFSFADVILAQIAEEVNLDVPSWTCQAAGTSPSSAWKRSTRPRCERNLVHTGRNFSCIPTMLAIIPH